MTNPLNYHSSKHRGQSSGAWAHPPRKTPTPPNVPHLERNGPRMAFLCIVVMVTLGAAAWGWPEFIAWMSGGVEVGVTRD